MYTTTKLEKKTLVVASLAIIQTIGNVNILKTLQKWRKTGKKKFEEYFKNCVDMWKDFHFCKILKIQEETLLHASVK
jgi:hypothetical protein